MAAASLSVSAANAFCRGRLDGRKRSNFGMQIHFLEGPQFATVPGMEKVNISLSGLIYEEDGEYVALALEMDLRGYGATPDEARADLDEQVRLQLSFAIQKHGSIDSAMFPAEQKYYDMYRAAKLEQMKAQFGEHASQKSRATWADLPIPDPHVISQIQGDFSLWHG